MVNNENGFSAIEIMIAFAILSIVLVGTVLADFSTSYWTLSSEMSSEALLKATHCLESLRTEAKQNFFSVVSNHSNCSNVSDASYVVKNTIVDVSSCLKEAESMVSWIIPRYPQSSISLETFIANPNEALAVGGDCEAEYKTNSWATTTISTNTFAGDPTAMDVLNGVAYTATNQSPYLQIATIDDIQHNKGSELFNNNFQGSAKLNALDAVNDPATGRTYVHAVADTPDHQFHIIDVTDIHNPKEVVYADDGVAGLSLLHVDPLGSAPEGWRIFYYKQKVYVITRETSGPELHIFDVRLPYSSYEMSYYSIDISVYAMQIREQMINNSLHIVAYLGTTNSSKKILALDVTDPQNITILNQCSLGSGTINSLSLLGNMLYIGQSGTVNGSAMLSALDISDPTASPFCSPIKQTDVWTSGFSWHVSSVVAAGPYLFIGRNNTTNAHGEIQIRSNNSLLHFPLVRSFPVLNLIDNGIDFDNGFIFAANSATPQLYLFSHN